ncbi:MAG: hypothetical protein GX854_08200 [Clostridiales bacterium]|nr:hypothetical protein [Clostridiales bacterium]
MKIVETPWDELGKFVIFIVGIPFFIIGILSRSRPYIINGALWIIFAGGLKIKSIYNRHKLKTLKREGLCFDGSVINIIPAPWLRIGSYVTARVECLYKTERGDSSVKSGYHLLLPFDRKEDLHTKIYFDHNNLERYFVELFRKGG